MQYELGIKNWLNKRKISDATIRQFGLKFDGKVTIPICDSDGNFLFNKYRRNPFLPETGMKYWYDAGTSAALFGVQFIKDKKSVVITEGELDALVLWSANIPAVSSTGGAKTFKEEWAEFLKDKEVFICYDMDLAGAQGAVHTLSIIPHAKVVFLPTVTDIKDISDYYERGGDFRNLMANAKYYADLNDISEDKKVRAGQWLSTLFHDEWIKEFEKTQEELRWKHPAKADFLNPDFKSEIDRAKSTPIDSIIKVGRNKKTLCLFHQDSNPSMHIFPNNRFYCFSCGKYGDVIDIVMERDGINFTEAVKKLI